MKPERFPLVWPQGYPVTERREKSNFKADFVKCRDGMINEFKLLLSPASFQGMIISTNMPHNKDGLITGKAPLMYPNPGIAVYFEFGGEDKILACDHWMYLHENMRAIQYTVQSLRSLERHKCTDILSRTMTGLKALPQNAGDSNVAWWDILAIDRHAPWSWIESRYKQLVKYHHPDNQDTGNREMFDRAQDAYKQAKIAFKIK